MSKEDNKENALPPAIGFDAVQVLECIGDACYVLDQEWRFVFLNAHAERLVRRTRAELLGKCVWDEFPEAVGSGFDRQYRRAVAEQISVSVEEFYPPLDTWFDVRAFPCHGGVCVFFQNIDARKQAERAAQGRTAAILDSITDGCFVIDREWRFRYVNAQAERMLHRTREELLGRDIWEAFPEAVGGLFYHLYHRAMDENVVLSVEDYYAPLDSWMNVRVYPSSDGLSVFFQNVNARKKAELERERLLSDERARAEREALVNRIGQALLATTDPAVIQESAVALLGEALGVDRCYLSSWDAAGERILVLKDYRRADLPSVAGEYPAAQYAVVMNALFVCGTAVIPNVRAADLPDTVVDMMESFALHSVLAVPFFEGDGRITAALMVAMADVPRDWTPEEVSLVETVAVLTRTAVESARVAQQEHAIANQLQKALQPPTPTVMPGLALADYYRPAWEDHGVGGDFSDVFGGDVGTTFLVVGDLSGKGLSAASQVATVRHMLRFALLNGGAVVGAVTALSRTLAEHGLLTGFATLFAGAYDSSAGTLTYVNCGQEPALVRRAAGTIEQLASTGPILGAFASASFTEQVVTLAPGDAIVLFTDGLTEVGRSRQEMLGVAGIIELLATPAKEIENAEALAKHLVLRLVAGVDAAAQDGVRRDDMCLLVGVVP